MSVLFLSFLVLFLSLWYYGCSLGVTISSFFMEFSLETSYCTTDHTSWFFDLVFSTMTVKASLESPFVIFDLPKSWIFSR